MVRRSLEFAVGVYVSTSLLAFPPLGIVSRQAPLADLETHPSNAIAPLCVSPWDCDGDGVPVWKDCDDLDPTVGICGSEERVGVKTSAVVAARSSF